MNMSVSIDKIMPLEFRRHLDSLNADIISKQEDGHWCCNDEYYTYILFDSCRRLRFKTVKRIIIENK